MSSVDGRLLPSRWTQPYDGTSPADLFKEYSEIGRLLETDAWMFGKATTKESFPLTYISQSKEIIDKRWDYIPSRLTERLFITIDPDGDITYNSNTFRGDSIITILSKKTKVEYLAFLEELGIGYIVVEDIRDLPAIMSRLYELYGVQSISLQGGGIMNGAMLAAGLLDELSLVIYPGIDGLTTSPSIFEYLGADDERPADGQALELLSSETRSHGIMWLRYKFHKFSK